MGVLSYIRETYEAFLKSITEDPAPEEELSEKGLDLIIWDSADFDDEPRDVPEYIPNLERITIGRELHTGETGSIASKIIKASGYDRKPVGVTFERKGDRTDFVSETLRFPNVPSGHSAATYVEKCLVMGGHQPYSINYGREIIYFFRE